MPDDTEIVVNQKVFNEMIDKIGSSKTCGVISDDEVWNIINASFSIRKDGKTVPIQDYFAMENMSIEETKDLILGKIFLFENPYIPQTRANEPSDEPSLEEIRNAMLDECENGYIEPLTTTCKLAVKISYYYKKITS